MNPTEKQQEALIPEVTKAIRHLKPGSTRKEIELLFERDGGISEATVERYFFKDHPFIKIEVRYDASKGRPDDKAVSISPPFAQTPYLD